MLTRKDKKWFRESRVERMSGWGTFKIRLMRYLKIPEDQFTTWDVPEEWIEYFKKKIQK